MGTYRIISTGNTIIADESFVQTHYQNDFELVIFIDPTPTPSPTLAPDPTASYIDIGPFFDRFGTSKLPILMSADPLVKALMSDIQVRKWIDLQRPDVAQALDVLISKSLVTPTLKTAILDTPISSEENMVLRKLYFS